MGTDRFAQQHLYVLSYIHSDVAQLQPDARHAYLFG